MRRKQLIKFQLCFEFIILRCFIIVVYVKYIRSFLTIISQLNMKALLLLGFLILLSCQFDFGDIAKIGEDIKNGVVQAEQTVQNFAKESVASVTNTIQEKVNGQPKQPPPPQPIVQQPTQPSKPTDLPLQSPPAQAPKEKVETLTPLEPLPSNEATPEIMIRGAPLNPEAPPEIEKQMEEKLDLTSQQSEPTPKEQVQPKEERSPSHRNRKEGRRGHRRHNRRNADMNSEQIRERWSEIKDNNKNNGDMSYQERKEMWIAKHQNKQHPHKPRREDIQTSTISQPEQPANAEVQQSKEEQIQAQPSPSSPTVIVSLLNLQVQKP